MPYGHLKKFAPYTANFCKNASKSGGVFLQVLYRYIYIWE